MREHPAARERLEFSVKDRTTGRRLRDDGSSAVIAADTAVHRGYSDHVRSALNELIESGVEFDADDVRARIPDGAVPHSPNLLPAIIGGYAAAGRIRSVGMTRPARASRRHSRNLVWVRGEAGAA
ncbi:hypothetical protein SEA_ONEDIRECTION_37 [Gordonia phage OneDirection]|nr:hypothetical protein SEA_ONEDIRECTION_37 [Gordonia phage OneDirection]